MKRSLIYCFFISVLIVGLVSCKKEEFTFVKVKVKNAFTNVSLPNIIVKIFDIHSKKQLTAQGGIVTKVYYRTLKEGVTDSNGEFDFGYLETYKKSDYEYYVGACNQPPCTNSVSLNKGSLNIVIINYK